MRQIFLLMFVFSMPAYAYLTPSGTNASQLRGFNISSATPSSNNCLVFSGGSWAPGSCAAGGTGITSINLDTAADQLLVTGTTGTDFAIVDDGAGTHTFNLPSASATARGLISTGSQTLAGAKTFSSAVTVPAGSSGTPGLNIGGTGTSFYNCDGQIHGGSTNAVCLNTGGTSGTGILGFGNANGSGIPLIGSPLNSGLALVSGVNSTGSTGSVGAEIRIYSRNAPAHGSSLFLSNIADYLGNTFGFGLDDGGVVTPFMVSFVGVGGQLIGATTSMGTYPTLGPNQKEEIYESTAATAVYTQWDSAVTGRASGDGLLVGVDASGNAVVKDQENTATIFYNNGNESARFTAANALQIPGLTASRAVFTDGSKNMVSNAITGTGNVVMSASPTLSGTVTLPSGTVSSSAWDTGSSTFTSNGVAFTAKAPLASPTFTGTVTLPSGSVSSSAWDTGSSTFTSNGVAFTAKAPLASPTFTGTVALPSATISGTLKSGNYDMTPGITANGNTSTAQTIDWSAKAYQTSTLTGNVTYTFTNPQTGSPYVLQISTGAGNFAMTWPGTVVWLNSGNTAPSTCASASKILIVNFAYDGTTYYASYQTNC